MAWQFDHVVPAQYPRLFSTLWLKWRFIKWKSERVVLLPSIPLSLFISLWIKAKGFVIKRHQLCLLTSHLENTTLSLPHSTTVTPVLLFFHKCQACPITASLCHFRSCKLSPHLRHPGLNVLILKSLTKLWLLNETFTDNFIYYWSPALLIQFCSYLL